MYRFLAALMLLQPLAAPSASATCEVELVLAMDVSRSVDAAEFRLIRHGTAEAFRHPDILELISWMNGGVLVSVTQWSGKDEQKQMIPWRLLTDVDQTRRFADEIDAMKRAFRYELTAPGEALEHAASLGQSAPEKCRRRVIDIAGDGVRNTGADVAVVADRIAALGITINGLVVLGDSPNPLEFYQTQVKRGSLSFVEISNGYDDFPRSIFLKLLREISPSLSMNTQQ